MKSTVIILLLMTLPMSMLAQESASIQDPIEQGNDAQIKKALETLAGDPEGYKRFAKEGRLLVKQGKTDEAANAYERSLRYRTSDAFVQIHYGVVLIHLAAAREAGEMDGTTRVQKGLSHILTGLSLETASIKNSESLARVAFEDIWQVMPDLKRLHPVVWVGLASLLETGCKAANSDRIVEEVSSLLGVDGIRNWPGFISKLSAAGNAAQPSPGKGIWKLLPPDIQSTVQKLVGSSPQEEQKANIINALNEKILRRRDFYEKGHFSSIEVSEEAQELLSNQDSLLSSHVQRLNRLLIESAYPHEIAENSVDRIRRWWGKRRSLWILEPRWKALEASWFFSEAKRLELSDRTAALNLYRQAAKAAAALRDSSRARCHTEAVRVAVGCDSLGLALEHARLAAYLHPESYSEELAGVVRMISDREGKEPVPDWAQVIRLNHEVVGLRHIDTQQRAASWARIAIGAQATGGKLEMAAQAALKAYRIGGCEYLETAKSVLSAIADYQWLVEQLESECKR